MSTQVKLADRSLAWKLAAIRRNIEPVIKAHGPRRDDDDLFTYPPADKVIEVVRTQLMRKRVLAISRRAEARPLGDGKVAVEVWVEFVNEDSPHETYEAGWVGEGDTAVKAATSAYKGLMLSTFLIRTSEPEPRDAHEARAQKVKAAPAITSGQRRHLIPAAATKAGLDQINLLRVASDLLGLEVPMNSLDAFPRDRVDDLLKAIEEETA